MKRLRRNESKISKDPNTKGSKGIWFLPVEIAMNAKLSFIDELRAERANYITRRWFFRQCGVGLGSIALASLLDPGKVFGGEKMAAAANPLAPRKPHFKPKAKRSSTCSWAARRASSICSITIRPSPNT